MISGMVMIFVALWFYQSAMKAKVSNVLMWVAIGAVGFFALQWLLVKRQYLYFGVVQSQ